MTEVKDVDFEIDFLEHYGVKGMKWGVRRTQAQLDRAAGRPVSKSSSSNSGSSRKNKKKKAKLGSKVVKGRGSSDSDSDSNSNKKQPKNAAQRAGQKAGEAIADRREVRNQNKALAKLASRPVSDLTTAELREVTNRLNLEQQYSKLTAQDKKGFKANVDKALGGAKFVNEVLTTGTNLYNNGKKIAQISDELKNRR